MYFYAELAVFFPGCDRNCERLIAAAAAFDIYVRNQSTESRDKKYPAE